MDSQTTFLQLRKQQLTCLHEQQLCFLEMKWIFKDQVNPSFWEKLGQIHISPIFWGSKELQNCWLQQSRKISVLHSDLVTFF